MHKKKAIPPHSLLSRVRRAAINSCPCLAQAGTIGRLGPLLPWRGCHDSNVRHGVGDGGWSRRTAGKGLNRRLWLAAVNALSSENHKLGKARASV
jgi:hypothetical protein